MFCTSAFGQGSQEQKYVKWSAKSLEGKLILKAEIEGKWHMYSTEPVENGPFPTTIESESLILGKKIEEFTPEIKFDRNFELNVKTFAKTAEFHVPVEKVVSNPASISITYQLCDDRSCLLPTTDELTVTTDTSPVPGATSQTSKKDYGTLLAFFATALGAGLLALVTPCVFPMIPITVSIFSKQGQGSGIKHALAFCIGIISTFTLLGVGFSVIFGAAGLQNFANDPWVNLFMGLLFVVLALSLFGVFELQLPTSWANKINNQKRGGLAGPLAMGLVFSITSFTCTMPFVGTLLVSAAQGDILFPIVGMLGFSTAFSLPFFGLALFPQAVSKLPKSGGWLASVKAYMGFIELLAAVKFFSTVDLNWQLGWLTKDVVISLWFAIMAIAGFFLFGGLKIPSVPDESKPGFGRMAFGLASIGCAFWFLTALNGNSLRDLESFLPPSPYPFKEGSKAARSEKAEDGWITNYEEAVVQAKQSGKPIFIDFTGIFCSNCRYMEKNVFSTEPVQQEFKNFVLVKLYTDRPKNPDDFRYQNLKVQLTGSVANPVYAILTPDEKLVSYREFERDVNAFVAFLKQRS
jgi:thiol:disulfide interchange protein DsbD